MTTDHHNAGAWIAGGVLLATAVTLALSCAGTSSVRFGDQVDVSKYPKDIQDAYEVFAVRCSRCHTLARPLNAKIRDPEHWVRYVTRMRRNPSSGINPKDAETILRFLLYYTDRLREEDEGGSVSAPAPAPVAPAAPAAPAAPVEVPVSPSPTVVVPESPAPPNPAAPESSMTEPASKPSDGGTP